MENKKWLPSDTRNRLIDLCKDRNISQAQLAGVIGIDRSALSRFLSGKTDSMSHEHVIAIAKYFNVSTDETLVNSILGQRDMTDAPESVKPEMNRVIARLREDLTDYFNILNAAKEQIG